MIEISSLKTTFEQALSSPSGRMIIIDQKPFMFAAVNDNNRAALFIRVSLKVSQMVNDGQGFSVKTTRSGINDYVQITATDQGIPILFLKLVEYILERVSTATSVDKGAEVLIRSIEEYRRFVSQRRGRLSETEVRGIFAEIYFLRMLISTGMNVEVALESWRGPWTKAGIGIHDFTFADGRGIEIKSTHQPPGTVRVSSPSQLIPSDQPLDLLVLPVEDAPVDSVAGIPFRHYLLQTHDIVVATGPVALEKWDSALSFLNLNLDDEWYDKYRFLPGQWQRFKVIGSFPHLDIPSLPAGIVDVHYSIELLRLTPFTASLDELLLEVSNI